MVKGAIKGEAKDVVKGGVRGVTKSCESPEGVIVTYPVLLESNIDDMTAEHVAFLLEELFRAGALDAWQESIFMKKGRMGTKVCALVAEEAREGVLGVFFRHSTTLGIRETEVRRYALPRRGTVLRTESGPVNVKVSLTPDGCERSKVEYEDCRRLARESGKTIAEVEREMRNAFDRSGQGE